MILALTGRLLSSLPCLDSSSQPGWCLPPTNSHLQLVPKTFKFDQNISDDELTRCAVTPPALVEILGVDLLTSAFGTLTFVRGVAALIGIVVVIMILIGVERNQKQRIPVSSVTS